jgi:hypothetical protein
MDDPLLPIHVRAMQASPFLRAQTSADREYRDRRVTGIQLARDRLDLAPCLERMDRAPLVPPPASAVFGSTT